jgi:5-methylthioadenosine/S-adenosylhomocysteine deaminase
MPVSVIHDTTIVTADDAGALHYGAALAVDGGRIAALGPTPELLARFPDAERVDGRRRAVLPGFANTHTHLSRVLARGIYEDLSPSHTPPFTGGLAPLPTPALGPDEERVMVLLGALEAIRSGTTLALEESARIDGYAGALADTGLRLLLCERAWDRARASIGQPGPFEIDRALGDGGLERIARLHQRWNGAADGRVHTGVAPGRRTCARRRCSAGSASCRTSSGSRPPCTSTRSGARWPRSRSSVGCGRPSTSPARGSSPAG